MMKTHHKIICGDSRLMSELDAESIELIVTSPPYWQLKDYGSEQQIGFHESYESYINQLNLVWAECDRVLQKGCRLCINIGDQFARSVYYGRYKVIPIRTEIIKFCETLGLDYMGAVIWQKATTMNTTGGGAVMGSFPYPRNGILKLDYEFILIFKKQGSAPTVDLPNKELSRLTTDEWNTYFQGHWNFAGAKQDGHLAMFPEELPKRLIKMFSFAGETVLDPFLGSGTTALAAKHLGRNSVGYEINAEFLPFIRQKLGVSDNEMFNEASFEFTKQETLSVNFEARILQQPYIFKDPHALDKKIHPKSLPSFGSRIDKESGEREDFFTVKEVLSAELVRLSSGAVVRLIGIKAHPALKDQAVQYLQQKTKGQRVFLKYDAEKFDAEQRVFGYLYLQNKTFVNAHLLKAGLAVVDDAQAFKHKEKFKRFSAEKKINAEERS